MMGPRGIHIMILALYYGSNIERGEHGRGRALATPPERCALSAHHAVLAAPRSLTAHFATRGVGVEAHQQ